MDLVGIVEQRGSLRGSYVIVDSFLNHRVEPDVLAGVGRTLRDRTSDVPYDMIVTAEASGIPPAMALSNLTDRPFIYAKKSHRKALDDAYTRTVSSPTKVEDIHLSVRYSVLPAGQRILIVDDFLSSGRSVLALADIIEEAGCTVTACIFVIEKTFDSGRRLLTERGLDVRSLVTVAVSDDGLEVGGGR